MAVIAAVRPSIRTTLLTVGLGRVRSAAAGRRSTSPSKRDPIDARRTAGDRSLRLPVCRDRPDGHRHLLPATIDLTGRRRHDQPVDSCGRFADLQPGGDRSRKSDARRTHAPRHIERQAACERDGVLEIGAGAGGRLEPAAVPRRRSGSASSSSRPGPSCRGGPRAAPARGRSGTIAQPAATGRTRAVTSTRHGLAAAPGSPPGHRRWPIDALENRRRGNGGPTKTLPDPKELQEVAVAKSWHRVQDGRVDPRNRRAPAPVRGRRPVRDSTPRGSCGGGGSGATADRGQGGFLPGCSGPEPGPADRGRKQR